MIRTPFVRRALGAAAPLAGFVYAASAALLATSAAAHPADAPHVHMAGAIVFAAPLVLLAAVGLAALVVAARRGGRARR